MSAYFKRFETFLQILFCALLLKGLQYWQPHPDRDDMASMILVSGHLDDYNRLFSEDSSASGFRNAAVWQEFYKDTASVGKVLSDLQQFDVHPPLFFAVVTWLNKWVNHTEEALLMMQLICWVLSILAFQWVGKRWHLSEKGIRILSWMAVLSPWCLACFGEYRHYGLMFLEATLLLYLFPRRDIKASWLECAAWGLTWALAFATHYGSLFFALSTLVLFLLQRPPRWIAYGIAMALGFGLFLWAWPVALQTLGGSDNGEAFSLVRGFKIFPALLSFSLPVWSAFVWDHFLVKVFLLVLGAFLLLKIRNREYKMADPLWIGLLFAFIYTLLSISGRIPGHAAGGKYLAFAYPSLLLAVAIRLESWKIRSLTWLLAGSFAITLAQELYVRGQERDKLLEIASSRKLISNYPDMFNAFRLVYVLPPETPVFMGYPGDALPEAEPGDVFWYDMQGNWRPGDNNKVIPLRLRSTTVQGWFYEPVFPGH